MTADKLVEKINKSLKKWAEELLSDDTGQEYFGFVVMIEKEPNTEEIAYLRIEQTYGSGGTSCDTEDNEDSELQRPDKG